MVGALSKKTLDLHNLPEKRTERNGRFFFYPNQVNLINNHDIIFV